jgi:UrcA family protein
MHKKMTLLLATLGVALASGVAAAADPTYTSEIVVQSPRVTTEYSPWLRSRVERFTTTVRVGYSDLDLTDRSGVQVLQGRVKTAAQLACQKLNHVIPVSDLACLEDTLAATQPRVQAAVNAAMQAAVSAKQDRSQS